MDEYNTAILKLLKDNLESYLNLINNQMEKIGKDNVKDYYKFYHVANGLWNTLADIDRALEK